MLKLECILFYIFNHTYNITGENWWNHIINCHVGYITGKKWTWKQFK